MESTCDYHDEHDRETDRPCGNRCGKTATRVIFWRDGRWSLGCKDHAEEIETHVPGLVRSIKVIAGDRAEF